MASFSSIIIPQKFPWQARRIGKITYKIIEILHNLTYCHNHTSTSKKPKTGAKYFFPLETNIILIVPIVTSIILEKNISSGRISQLNSPEFTMPSILIESSSQLRVTYNSILYASQWSTFYYFQRNPEYNFH